MCLKCLCLGVMVCSLPSMKSPIMTWWYNLTAASSLLLSTIPRKQQWLAHLIQLLLQSLKPGLQCWLGFNMWTYHPRWNRCMCLGPITGRFGSICIYHITSPSPNETTRPLTTTPSLSTTTAWPHHNSAIRHNNAKPSLSIWRMCEG